MSQVTGRINLSARTFPFVSQNWGRTVMVPTSADNNFNRQVQSTQDQDHDVGIPQAYYMHNVMPHAQGFQSVAYNSIVTAAAGELTFQYVRELKDNLGNYALLGICSNGKWYVRETLGVWTLVYTSSFPTLPVYIAYINGITYVHQRGTGPRVYDWTLHTFTSVTFLGIDPTVIDGITASFGYMIAWAGINGGYTVNVTAVIATNKVTTAPGFAARVGDVVSSPFFPAGTQITSIDFLNNWIYLSNVSSANGVTTLTKAASPGAVYWSSTISELDFVPSLLTGAGGGEVQGAQGLITVCLPHTNGFIVYTTKNAVGASYSGNIRYPFNFNAIVGSGGVTDFEVITQEGDTGNHYAYTTNGVQLISIGSATNSFPDITDFISGKLFEDFNDVTKTFTLTRLSNTLVKKITIVSARYLVLSYGVTSLTHALVYDLITQRFGKLRTPHVFCFEVAPNVTNAITDLPRQAIGFLNNDGSCTVVDFDVYNPASNGTLILGKYQYVRARNLILDQFWIENVYNAATFACTIMTSLDGKVISSLDTPTLTLNASGQSSYTARSEGQNISLLLQGQFHIESGVLAFNVGGKR